jgi:tripartite ATP-independent transporter DctP family solute receptor
MAADKTVVLMISTQNTAEDTLTKGMMQLAERVSEKTNGNMKIEVYPSGQLGSDEDVIEQALAGVNVAVLTDAARMGNYVSDIGIFSVSYFLDSYEEALKALNTPFFQDCVKRLSDGAGIEVLTFNWNGGMRHYWTNKPVKNPADLKGLRIRTAGAPAWSKSCEYMGAIPIVMSSGETYTGLQQKIADGCEFPYYVVNSFKIYEVLKYVNETAHHNLLNGFIVSKKWFDTVPKEYQALLKEEFYNQGIITAKEFEIMDNDCKEKILATGVTLVEVDRDAFRNAVEPLYAEMGWAENKAEIYRQMGKK